MFNLGLGKAPAEAPAPASIQPASLPTRSEEDELADLQQMFSSRGPYPPPRDSTIPKTTLAKLKVGEELLLHADEARQEKVLRPDHDDRQDGPEEDVPQECAGELARLCLMHVGVERFIIQSHMVELLPDPVDIMGAGQGGWKCGAARDGSKISQHLPPAPANEERG